MKTVKTLLKNLAFMALTTTAYAGHNDSDYRYAQVVDVHPIYENYQVPETRRICNNRTNNRDRNYHTNHHSNTRGAIVGGIIGGLIGNRFGKGHGRDAATAVGVLTGASIGANAKHNKHNSQHCYTQTDYRQQQRIAGYDVSYDYNGRVHQTRMQNHPGNRVRLLVTVQVAEY